MSEYLNVYKAPSETLSYFRFDGFESFVASTKMPGEVPFEQYEDVHRVFVTLAGRTRATIAEIDQLPTVRRPDRPGATTIVPAGVRRRVLLQDIDFVILDLRISDRFLKHYGEDDAAQPRARTVELPLVQNVLNGWMLRAAHAYSDAASDGASAMHMQTLAYSLVRHLARSPRRVSESGGLDGRALNRVLQLMHDRLAEDVTLTELADESGLGVSAFGRAFRKSLGVPPYRYFLAARMRRAKELLARSDLPLAAIAGEAGYADQAHFTAAFTRETGVPPGKWRAEADVFP
jgi:AraC-like DNA-binding protein